jgi:nucleoredoxin
MKIPTFLSALFLCLLFCGSLVLGQEATTATAEATEEAAATTDGAATATESGEEAQLEEEIAEEQHQQEEEAEPVQAGPFIDLFGDRLLSFEFLDETRGQINGNYTNEALSGKKVVGLYFSADWCGPCRQFTPELVSFYERMNKRRGKKDQFEIVWVSRCRDGNSYGQYFSSMPWLALPPEEAMGARGQELGDKYKVKGIPSLVLLDDLGNTITIDGRNKIPQDKAGVGFPWRNPVSQIVATLVPRSLRLLIKTQIEAVKKNVIDKLKTIFGLKKKSAA